MNPSLRLQIDNLGYPVELKQIPRAQWPAMEAMRAESKPFEVWRSRGFLVMFYFDDGYVRMSALRTELRTDGRFEDLISWDEMQRLKAEAGRGDKWAVEIFPPDAAVVNVANLRHLFFLKEPPPYGWHKRKA